MSRETAYARMLDASAKLQWNIALILDAKALEAEKVRSWLCNHVSTDAYGVQQDQLKDSLIVHDQVIEVIEGLTKLNQGMTSVLRAALRHDQERGGGYYGGGFSLGDRDE
ncbi:hypothetical protein FHS18_005744 [Paenibacillus phyllosphaerae]|uniref:Restriction endonuclease subunit S n=1 Tax=Paenibacillus phyllosphaerae TaxID=274593 RepID=A0A7W5B4P6_9BACL|nr:restriction endonuclease subunit S [Paenibacillus phyllosphaerae]MBB3113631.1 hypothetical protein [Paenibacillus phyllosphaerae]